MISSIQIRTRKSDGTTEPLEIENPMLKQRAIDIATFRTLDAKALNRKVTFHSGPPNSGKTYNAIVALQKAKSGIYCAPLRLMAFEVYDQLTKLGIDCNLITGEEQLLNHKHPQVICSTIEMASFSAEYDFAVIDEIQMMNSRSRGFAWTRAYMNLDAKDLHVCGDLRTLPLLQKLSDVLKDTISVVRYQRKVPLEMDACSLKGVYKSLKRGDALVVFSRQAVFEYKKAIELSTHFKCAVIYGALPPQPRRNQAELFNSGQREILVCTDAIGMGLNLNIERVVFMSMRRKIGRNYVDADHAQVQQIAGRAGRYGIFNKGYTTTFHEKDFQLLDKFIKTDPKDVLQMGFFPSLDQFKRFKKCLPFVNSFSRLCMMFKHYSVCGEEDSFVCDMEAFLNRVRLLESVSLPLADKYYFCLAPCHARAGPEASTLLKFAHAFSAKKYVDIVAHLKKVFPGLLHTRFTSKAVWEIMEDCVQPSQFPEIAEEELILFNGITFDSPLVQQLEVFHKTLTLICYLRYRHEKTKTFMTEGYSHFNTQFLLEWLKSSTEECLEEIMSLEMTEEDLLLEEFNGDMELLAGLDVALKNYLTID